VIDRSTLRRAWSLLDGRERRQAVRMLALLCVSALASAAMVASIYPFLAILSDPSLADDIAVVAWLRRWAGLEGDHSLVMTLGLGTIALIVATNIVLIFAAAVISSFTAHRAHTLSRRLLAHYLAQPYAFYLDRHSGDLATRVLSETQEVVGGYFRPAAELVAASLTAAAVVVTVLVIDPVIGLVGFAIIGAFYATTLSVTRALVQRMGAVRAQANERRYRIASEVIGGIKEVKLLGQERAYLGRYSGPSEEMAQASARIGVISEAPQFVLRMLTFSGIIVICLVLLDPALLGTEAALGGILPILGLLAFAAQRLTPEFHKIYNGITQLRFRTAAVDRVWRDLSQRTDEDVEAALPEPMPRGLGLARALELDGVSYRYPNADRAGLSGIDLTIRAGERIGVVGATGAGKTTLADIVLGLLEPVSGRLRTDGTEITRDNLRAWQRSVSYVPQDIFLTDASIAENIALGIPPAEIDAARVEECARKAHLHGFITSELPQGYATRTGERGVRLSGGQRQRIGIARALYHEADLIVLDEATSALDTLTEREVMGAIANLPGTKTVMMIAHRLSTVRACDRIVVLSGGRIEACGPWDELLAHSPAFRDLVRHSDIAPADVAE
jgi:ABC-type multidrug transport system fused ATPase/permease subunit